MPAEETPEFPVLIHNSQSSPIWGKNDVAFPQTLWMSSLLGVAALYICIIGGGRFLLQILSVSRFAESTSSQSFLDAESVDRLLWASVLIFIVVLCVLSAVRSKRSHQFLNRDYSQSTGVGILLVVVLLASIGFQQGTDYGVSWSGFGVTPMLITCLLVIALSASWNRIHETTFKPYSALVAIAVLLIYVPAAVQPRWGLGNDYHASYILNELLGPGFGKLGGGDAAYQYINLLSLPIAPLLPILKALSIAYLSSQFAALYLSALGIFALILMILLVRKVLPVKLRPMAPLLAIPLLMMNGTLVNLPSLLPTRLLAVLLAGVACVMIAPRRSMRGVFILGCISGAVAVNNGEFGIPSAIAIFVTVLAVSVFRYSRFAVAIVFFAGTVSAVVAYVLLVSALNGSFSYELFAAFALSFAAGFGSIPMELFGPQVLVIGVMTAGCILGLTQFVKDGEARRDADFARSITLIYFGSAGLLSLGYFINRSQVHGQLEAFFTFVVPIACAVAGMLSESFSDRPNRAPISFGVVSILIPLCLLPVGLLWAPDLGSSLNRIGGNSDTQSGMHLNDEIEAVRTAISALPNTVSSQDVPIAVNFGNIMESYLGNPSISRIDYPAEARYLGEPVANAYCNGLELASSDYILAQDFFRIRVAPSVKVNRLLVSSGEPTCAGFELIKDLGSGFSLIHRKASLKG
jgi:hypothetical protein